MPPTNALQATPNHHHERLAMQTEWVDSAVVRITVAGDVDASNAASLRDYVFRRAANCQRLVLDLRDVKFFSTAGFSALRTVDKGCNDARISLTLIGGPVVTRVLTICDPERTLPLDPAS